MDEEPSMATLKILGKARGVFSLVGVLKNKVSALHPFSRFGSAMVAVENLEPALIAIFPTVIVMVVLYGLSESKITLANLVAQLPRSPLRMLAPIFTNGFVVAAHGSEIEHVPNHTEAAKVNSSKKMPAIVQPTPTVKLSSGIKPLQQTRLEYPLEARDSHVSGPVEMQITIAEDGSVHDPQILNGDARLHANLADGVKRWLYQPMRIDGKAVPVTTRLVIQFSFE
jgi:TonB family protein